MVLEEQVIAAGVKLVETELSDGTSGNISVRCEGGSTILITPSSRDYRLLSERDLVRVDLQSGGAEGRRKPSSEWRQDARVDDARAYPKTPLHDHRPRCACLARDRHNHPAPV